MALLGALGVSVAHAAVTRIDELDFQSRSGLSFSEAFSELYELLLHGLVVD